MSRDQWSAIQHGDESYAGSPSWEIFQKAVKELFPFRRHSRCILRSCAAEKILFTVTGRSGNRC